MPVTLKVSVADAAELLNQATAASTRGISASGMVSLTCGIIFSPLEIKARQHICVPKADWFS
jgi:hypothetical protein